MIEELKKKFDEQLADKIDELYRYNTDYLYRKLDLKMDKISYAIGYLQAQDISKDKALNILTKIIQEEL